MKITGITMKRLKEGLGRTYDIETIKQIYILIEKSRAHEIASLDAHTQIDALLNNHGIESITFKIRGKIKYLKYSNSGDSYGVTVLRWIQNDGYYRSVRWDVGDWGSFAEKYIQVVYTNDAKLTMPWEED